MIGSEAADAVTDVAAVAGIAVIASTTAADPTTAVVSIAGIAGYRMRSRSRTQS